MWERLWLNPTSYKISGSFSQHKKVAVPHIRIIMTCLLDWLILSHSSWVFCSGPSIPTPFCFLSWCYSLEIFHYLSLNSLILFSVVLNVLMNLYKYLSFVTMLLFLTFVFDSFLWFPSLCWNFHLFMHVVYVSHIVHLFYYNC